MEPFIVFFRDILSGTTYTITTVISSILICACLGYLIDKKEKKKALEDQYISLDNEDNNTQSVQNEVPVQNPVVDTLEQPVTNEVKIEQLPQENTIDNQVIQEPIMEHPVKEQELEKLEINDPEVIEEIVLEQPVLEDVEIQEPIIEEAVVQEQEPNVIKAPIPIQPNITKEAKGVEEPLLPNDENNNNNVVSSPIPIIK